MKSLFFSLFFVFFISTVVAEGFSPSNLVYVLTPNEELCQVVSLESDSVNITVLDSWAENENVNWSISLFNTPAEDHSLTIDYPTELSIDEREVEVCVSGSKLGEYHGVIIFRQAQQGTSIIQLAVWLKVVIENPPQPTQEQQAPPANNGGGGSGGSGKAKTPAKNTTNATSTTNPSASNVELLSAQQQTETQDAASEPTGNAIQEEIESQPLLSPLRVIPIIFVIGVIIAVFVVRKKRRNAPLTPQEFRI